MLAPSALPRRTVPVLLGLGLMLGALPARADVTKDQCVDANTRGQSLRRSGKWTAAHEQLALCSDAKCPDLVRSDCIQRLDELERAQPTMVFDVKSATGGDVAAVRLSMDGRVLAERLDGAALRVDPGEHAFLFEAAGQPPVTRTFVVKEGEKDRRERVVLGEAAAPATPPADGTTAPAGGAQPASTPPSPAPTPPSDGAASPGMGGQKKAGLVLGGIGLAGLIVGGAFGGLASTSWNAQKTDCPSATNCPNRGQAVTDHNTTITDGAVSTAGFIAGGALVLGGALLFFTGGSASPATSTALSVAPSLGPGSAGLAIHGGF